ncbi:hypothetical protein TNCV_4981681 [Trichonephila clavipes]|nr:hypothetical protein TNCV_4981681 [Trichonephila clavipes]
MSPSFVTQGHLASDLVNLNHGKVTKTTPKLASLSETTIPHHRRTLNLLRFNLHHVKSCTRLEPMSCSQIEAHDIHHGKDDINVRWSLAVAMRTSQMAVRFHLSFEEEHPGRGSGPSTSHPWPSISREDLQLDCCLSYPPAAKAMYIYKHPCLLRESNPGPTAQLSESLTTIPDGRKDW